MTSIGANSNLGSQIGDFLNNALKGNPAAGVISSSVSLAIDMSAGNSIGMLKDLGKLFEGMGSMISGQPQQTVAPQPPLNNQLGQLLNQLLGVMNGLTQALKGGTQTQGAPAPTAGGAQTAAATQGSGGAGGAAQTNTAQQTADLFGNNALKQDIADGGSRDAKAAAASAKGGGPMSLGALLALVGNILTKSMTDTMKQLADAAKTLDGLTSAGGPTAQQNQKIQELTFNLQQIQQTLNRVNETVTNLSRSQSEAQKSTAQNLSV